MSAIDTLKSLRNPDPRIPIIQRLFDRNEYGTDAHIAARLLGDACTLADRAEDYLRTELPHDLLAKRLANELANFVKRVEFKLTPDESCP